MRVAARSYVRDCRARCVYAWYTVRFFFRARMLSVSLCARSYVVLCVRTVIIVHMHRMLVCTISEIHIAGNLDT